MATRAQREQFASLRNSDPLNEFNPALDVGEIPTKSPARRPTTLWRVAEERQDDHPDDRETA